MDSFLKMMIDIFRGVSKTVAAAFLCVLSLCGVLRAQWIDVTPDGGVQYNQIIFVDSLHGYMAADLRAPYPDTTGAILVTTNGGETWVEHIIANGGLLSVSAVGDSFVWASSDYGEVSSSRDGGMTWQHSTIPLPLLTIQFVDSLNGWVTGSYNTDEMGGYEGIYHSSDGGLTWQEQYGDSGFSAEYKVHIKKGYFIDSLHGWVADYYSVLRTTDAGATWIPAFADDYMYSVYFLDTLKGWATGYISAYKTVDGGVNWVELPGDTVISHSAISTSVFFADTANGWICDNYGGILRTTDGGTSWFIQRSDTPFYSGLNCIFFLNKNNGWAVGNGVVLHTTNGGVTAVRAAKTQPRTFLLSQNYPNPFNPTTTINYQLQTASHVTLKVYDILGREAATLVNARQSAGYYYANFDGSRFASGVYFYRLDAVKSDGKTFVAMKRMVLLK